MSEPLTDEELGRLVGGMIWRDTPEALAVTRIVEELRALRAWKTQADKDHELVRSITKRDMAEAKRELDQIDADFAELQRHRAWRKKLGDPDTWFPSLTWIDKKEWVGLPNGMKAFQNAMVRLCGEARALVERAKEGT